MNDISALIQSALDTGFTFAKELDCAALTPRTEVRDMCAVNKCGAYGHSWTCPPACGTIEECGARMRAFERGLIVQTMGTLEDEFDYETMQDTARRHSENIRAFAERLRARFPEVLVLGAGACRICPQCAYPDAPCRFPDKALYSMEGFGLVVSDVCRANSIPYNHGRGTLTYVGCFLFNEGR